MLQSSFYLSNVGSGGQTIGNFFQSRSLFNIFGNSVSPLPLTYIVPSYSIVKRQMQILYHTTAARGCHPFLYTLGGLRLVNGKWRVQQVIHHTFPGVRCQGPFNPVMGRGFEGNGRCRMEQVAWKYVECPLPEVLKHNKRTSAVQNMVKIPRFLKGRYRNGVTLSNF